VLRSARRIRKFADESACLTADNVRNGISYNSPITGGVENAVPLHVHIPRTGRRGSDLPFEAVLQEYLKFPYDYFILVLLLFGGYCCKLCPSNNLTKKNITGIKIG
jgi:hypothetical protein